MGGVKNAEHRQAAKGRLHRGGNGAKTLQPNHQAQAKEGQTVDKLYIGHAIYMLKSAAFKASCYRSCALATPAWTSRPSTTLSPWRSAWLSEQARRHPLSANWATQGKVLLVKA